MLHINNKEIVLVEDSKTVTHPYVLAVHSSKHILAEQHPAPPQTLADSVVQLAIAKGHRHEVSYTFSSPLGAFARPLALSVIHPVSYMYVSTIIILSDVHHVSALCL